MLQLCNTRNSIIAKVQRVMDAVFYAITDTPVTGI